MQLFQAVLDVVVLRPRLVAEGGAGAGFVQKVDGLVGQKAVADIPLRKGDDFFHNRRRHPDAVERLVILLDAVQNLLGVGERGLRNLHRLEAALQRGVLFDVFAVFLKRRRADDLNLPAGKRGFQDVGGVHRAFGVAGAHQVVDLVDEQNDVALGLHLVQKPLDAAFKLAAELRSGHQRREVQQVDFLFAEHRRDPALRDAEGEALRHGRFADAGLADQARVVFRPAAQNLDHARDFFLAPDDGVNLARPGLGRQVRAVGVQVLALRFMPFPRKPLGRLPVLHLLRRAAGKHVLQHRDGRRPARHKAAQGVFVFLFVGLRVLAHQVAQLRLHLFDLVVRNPHFVQQIVHRFYSQFPCADKAQPAALFDVARGRKENHGRPFVASGTHNHPSITSSLWSLILFYHTMKQTF